MSTSDEKQTQVAPGALVSVTLYLDVYQGIDWRFALATTSPGRKSKGVTRYAIAVTLPDPNQPDACMAVHAKEISGGDTAAG